MPFSGTAKTVCAPPRHHGHANVGTHYHRRRSRSGPQGGTLDFERGYRPEGVAPPGNSAASCGRRKEGVMNSTRRTIAGRDLKQRLDRGEDMLLLDVLPEQKFSDGHIAGSENVSSERPDFVQEVTSLAGNKNRHIVVYCGG